MRISSPVFSGILVTQATSVVEAMQLSKNIPEEEWPTLYQDDFKLASVERELGEVPGVTVTRVPERGLKVFTTNDNLEADTALLNIVTRHRAPHTFSTTEPADQNSLGKLLASSQRYLNTAKVLFRKQRLLTGSDSA